MDVQKKIAKRQEANRQIVAAISAMVEAHPELRFHQILSNMNVNKTTTPMSPDDMAKYVDEITDAKITAGYPEAIKKFGKHVEGPKQLDLFYEESIDTLARINGQA